MIRNTLLAAVLFAFTACGADGPPERPAGATGITVSGSVSAGITGGG